MDPTILLVGLAALLLLSRQQQSGTRTSSVIDEEREPEKAKDEDSSFLQDVTQLVRELGGLAGQFSSSDQDSSSTDSRSSSTGSGSSGWRDLPTPEDTREQMTFYRVGRDYDKYGLKAGTVIVKELFEIGAWIEITANADLTRWA